MCESNNIKLAKESVLLRRKLRSLGIGSIVGPTGPRGMPGTNINIRGSFPSIEELKKSHPSGSAGDTYIIQGDLYYWSEDTQTWENAGHIGGPTGSKGEKGEKGDIGPTGPIGMPGQPGLKGDKGDIGPTGPQGIKGDQGLIGPQGIQGSIGPKGDVGPIGPAGTKGEKGDTGPTGPTGAKGDKGDTGPAGPKGDSGETGPVGPQGAKGDPNGVGAYGERYSDSDQRFNVTADTEIIMPLEKTGPAIFTDYNSTYAIEIRKYGAYLISYFLNVSPSVDINYSISVRVSGIKLPASEVSASAKANTKSFISGSLIFSLTEDDEVTLVIKTDKNAELIFDGTTNAKLTVVKLD